MICKNNLSCLGGLVGVEMYYDIYPNNSPRAGLDKGPEGSRSFYVLVRFVFSGFITRSS